MAIYKIISLLVLLFLVVYEFLLRPLVCKKKIYEYVKKLNGTVLSIQNVSRRDEAYLVHYTEYGKRRKATVKFDFFYRFEWK